MSPVLTKHFSELSTREYHRIVQAREAVFFLEQHITEPGRVLVDAAYRRRGLCRSLMSEALRYIARTWGPQPIRISAQEHLAGFYATLGFAPVSDTYFEAGIPHVKMLRP